MILEDSFFNIEGSYGGRQQWLADSGSLKKFWADRSCGVAAAANVVTYMSRKNIRLSKLYMGEGKDSYTDLMKELYKYLNPRFYGIPTLGKMKRGVQKYAYSKGIILESFTENWIWDVKGGSDFIKRGLSLGNPVMLLTWNTADKEFKNHWVTITGWTIVNGVENMVVSNWGERRVYPYETWAKNRSLFKGAIYFEINGYAVKI